MREVSNPSISRGPGRFVRRAATLVLLALLLGVSTLIGVVLHLDTALGRRLIAREVNALVSGLVTSELRIEKIALLSHDRLLIERASLNDLQGKPVLWAEGLEARFGLISLLSGIVGASSVRVNVPEVRIERFGLGLNEDPKRSGHFTLESSFDSRTPKSGGPPAPVVVELPNIQVRSASVRTNLRALASASADVSALRAGLVVSNDGVVLTLDSRDAHVQKLLARDVRGQVGGQIRLPGVTAATFDVRAGNAPVAGSFRLDESGLGMTASSALLTPEAMRELFASWPLLVPLSARAEARGPADALKLLAEGRAGPTRVTANGTLALVPELKTELDVTLENLDFRAFSAAAPTTSLNASGRLELRFAPVLEVRFTANVPEWQLSGATVPPLDVRGTYAGGRLVGNLVTTSRESPLALDVELAPEGGMRFSGSATNADLRWLAAYGFPASGRATLRAQGTLEAGELSASFEGNVASFSAAGIEARSATFRGKLLGPVREPAALRLEAATQGTGLRVAGAAYQRFEARAGGSGKRQKISVELGSENQATLAASAELGLGEPLVVEGISAEARRGAAVSKLDVERLSLERRALTVQTLELQTGQGELSGSFALRPARERADLTAKGLDLALLARSLGLENRELGGVLDGRITIQESGGRRVGQARIRLREARVGELEKLEATLLAVVDGPSVEADATLEVPGLAQGKFEARGELRGALVAPDVLERMSGEATLRLHAIELDELSRRYLGETDLALRGQAEAELYARRQSPAARPELSYRVRTQGMVVAAVHEQRGAGKGELRAKLDLSSRGELMRAEGSRFWLELSDARGPWIEVELEHSLAARELERALSSGALDAIVDAPIHAQLKVNERSMSALGGVGLESLDGRLSAIAGVTGSLRRPELSASLRLSDLSVPAVGGDKLGLDAAFLYSSLRDRFAFEARTHEGQGDRLELSATGALGLAVAGPGGLPSARAQAIIERLDLARIGSVLGVPLTGSLTGQVLLELGDGNLDADAALDLAGISVEKRELGDGTLRASVKQGRAQAAFRLGNDQALLELEGAAGLLIRREGLLLDPARERTLRFTARAFELENFEPWLKPIVNQLSGKLNGHLDWTQRGGSAKEPGSSKLRANATISDGSLSLVAGGGLLEHVEIGAIAEGGGPLGIKFSAAARSRKPNIEGNAELRMRGASLDRLDAKVYFDGFPLVYEGVLLGKATIARGVPPLSLSVREREQATHLEVSVPALEVSLPEATDTALVSLDEDPSVVVVETPVSPQENARKLRSDGSLILSVKLGNQVRVTQGELRVPLGGALTLGVDGRLSGTIRFPPGGVVPAFGQTFRISEGFVRFKDQDVSEGVIAIKAVTRVADSTSVELNVSGTVGSPVVLLQSDPPRSEAEIVALLVGLRPEDSTGEHGQQLGGVAWALAMNRLVKGSALSRLQFGAGQTSEGNEVKTVSMRVGSKVWLEGRSVRASDTSLNQTDQASGVVDWRFAPSFSLRTQLGTVSGVELRWSHGY